MATMCSAVPLLVELRVVWGLALLGFQQVCRDVPRFISAQEKATHKQLNSSLAKRHCYLQEKTRLA